MMNLTLHKRGQKLFSSCKEADPLTILMKHFRSAVDQELETCINGSFYCLMNMKNLRERAY